MTARDYHGARNLISVLLLCFLVAVSAYLWVVDMASGQRVFGILMSGVLLAFSMLIYVYRNSSYERLNKTLLMVGYLALILLLSLGIAVSMGYA
jgi:hypothetical protein